MKLLGDWNWYLPSWLEWLPHLDEDTERPPETATPSPPRPTGQPRAPRARGDPKGLAMTLHTHTNRRSHAHRAGAARPRLPEARDAEETVSVPKGAVAGDLLLDPHLLHRERQLCGRLRDARRPGEPGRSAVPAHRASGDAHRRSLSDHPAEPVFWLKGGPVSRTWILPRRTGSPRTATSSSSAIAVSTAPRCSTVRRSSPLSSTRRTSSARNSSRVYRRLPGLRSSTHGRGRRPRRLHACATRGRFRGGAEGARL